MRSQCLGVARTAMWAENTETLTGQSQTDVTSLLCGGEKKKTEKEKAAFVCVCRREPAYLKSVSSSERNDNESADTSKGL